jgi:hypothetical protein
MYFQTLNLMLSDFQKAVVKNDASNDSRSQGA